MNVMLFVTCFLWRMRGKYQLFPDLLNATQFLVQMKHQRNSMGLIEVINFRFELQLFNKPCTSDTQQDELRHFRSNVCIIQTVSYGLRNVIILGYISTQKKQRGALESL